MLDEDDGAKCVIEERREDPVIIDMETAILNRLRDEIITECAGCEYCGGSIMEACEYLQNDTDPRRCTIHEKLNKLRADIITLTTECSSIWSRQMELDTLKNHRARLKVAKARMHRGEWCGGKSEEKFIDVDDYFRPHNHTKIPRDPWRR